MLTFIAGLITGGLIAFVVLCAFVASADRADQLTDEHAQFGGIGGGEILQHGTEQ